MKSKSLSINALLCFIRNIMKVVFPLLTFPYISRVLGVDNIGNFNFATSIVNYFALIAELGILTYSVREGARIRADKTNISIFINEIFTINVLSTLLSYTLMVIALFCIKDLKSSALLIILLSAKIIFTTIGLEWVYTIYEDFLYITVRSILLQISSLLLMFIFVKSNNDLYIYAGITVLASVGSNLYNWIHLKKYCCAKIIKKVNVNKHIKPILTIFVMTISISIYSTSDITILGIISGTHATGLYSVSAKIYDIAKSTLAAIILVAIPRLSALLGSSQFSLYEKTAEKIYKCLISFAFPAMIGIILLSKDIILIISGSDFIDATFSLRILCIAAIVNLGAWFYGQCVLIPLKKENIMLIMSVTTAILNIVLNILMIPLGAQNAAAMTTLISELVSFIIVWRYANKYVKFVGIFQTYAKTIIGSVIMAVAVLYIIHKNFSIYWEVVLCTFGGTLTYCLIEALLINREFLDIIRTLFGRLKMIKCNVNIK